jgi:hypothetical protein
MMMRAAADVVNLVAPRPPEAQMLGVSFARTLCATRALKSIAMLSMTRATLWQAALRVGAAEA